MRKNEKRFCEVLRIRSTFSLKIQFFIIFGLTLGTEFEILRYFHRKFQEMPFMNHNFWTSWAQHCNILRNKNAKNGSVRILRIRCTFSLKIQFFIIFGVTLVPDFEIFSQFQEMRFYESLLQHRNILRKSEKRFCEALWIRCNFSLNIFQNFS